MQQFGGELMRGSAMLGELGLKMQDDINRAIVADALNQAIDLKDRLTNDKDEGYTTLQGRNALDRPDGLSLTEEYAGKFDKGLQAIKGSLKNQAQLDLFNKSTMSLQAALISGTREHAMRQNTAYQNSVDNGSIASGQRMFVNAQSEEEQTSALNYMRNASNRMSMRLGVSEDEAAANERKAIGGAVVLASQKKMDAQDYDGARQVLEQYADYVDIDDYQKMLKDIDDFQTEAEGEAIGEQLASTGSAVIGKTSGKLGFVSAQYEGRVDSANRDNVGWAYGKYQFNSKVGGLQRFFQDNPSIAAEFAGLTPGTDAFNKKWREYARLHPKEFEAAQDKSAANIWYRPAAAAYAKAGFNLNDRRVQEAVFSASIQHGGVITKVLPIAQKLAGGSVARMSAEQQVRILYQARTQYQPGQAGRYQKELKTVLAMGGATVHVGDSQAAALEAINKLPERQRNAAMRRYQQIRAVKDQQYSEAMAKVVTTIAENNGDINAVSRSSLAALKPEDRMKVEQYAYGFKEFKNREAFQKNEKFYYMAKLYPENLLNMTEAQIINMGVDIGYDKAQDLVNTRRQLEEHKVKYGSDSNAPAKVNATVMKNIANLYSLPDLGKGNELDTQRYYNLWDNVQALSNEMAAKLGRPPTEAELFLAARKMVADKRILKQKWFGFYEYEYAAFMTPAQRNQYKEKVK